MIYCLLEFPLEEDKVIQKLWGILDQDSDYISDALHMDVSFFFLIVLCK